ncbi:prolipoprotein diacylglyceryl transferase [Anaeromicropila populeti]|uniref:Uncharacterized protein n=1 Tax=Anaeromicropila populeti TaxID=37658 RepID=A0A1I6KQ95_9FIRM|nr:hypothetical protein [Anaeromicropila populeti]SFR93403.1 hypothetical protein SAMN05661086_02575 [Anaeromicropila populeti]
MRKKYMLYVAALSVALFMTGCNAEKTNEETAVVENTESSQVSDENDEAMEAAGAESDLLGEVTAVSENSVTIAVGIQRQMGGGSNGEKPDGERPEGEAPSGETPDGKAPEGEAPSGEKPDGEVPEGEVPSGEKGKGGMLSLTGEEKEIVVSEQTEIVKESNNTSESITIADIQTGDILAIEYEEDGETVKSIIVKSFQMGDGRQKGNELKGE